MRVACSACRNPIEVQDQHLGQTVQCPHCRQSTVAVGPRPQPIGGGPPRPPQASKLPLGVRLTWIGASIVSGAGLVIAFAIAVNARTGELAPVSAPAWAAAVAVVAYVIGRAADRLNT